MRIRLMRIRGRAVVAVVLLIFYMTGCAAVQNAQTQSMQAQSLEGQSAQGQDSQVQSAPVQSPEAQDSQVQRFSCIVQVCCEKQWGSGIVCEKTEDELIVATCAHLTSAGGQITVIAGSCGADDDFAQAGESSGEAADAGLTQAGESSGEAADDELAQAAIFSGKLLEGADRKIAGADLSWIRVEAADLSDAQREVFDRIQPVCIDKEAFDAVKSGTAVAAAGKSKDGAVLVFEAELVYDWVYVEDYGQYMMIAALLEDAGKYPDGMSGGGLFDGNGHLLGILSGVSESGELAAVPLVVLQADAAECEPENKERFVH